MTVEQQFKMRRIEDALRDPGTKKEDIITVFLALQNQAFVLGNNVSNLLKNWPTPTYKDLPTTNEAQSMFGISSEIKS